MLLSDRVIKKKDIGAGSLDDLREENRDLRTIIEVLYIQSDLNNKQLNKFLEIEKILDKIDQTINELERKLNGYR